MSGINLLNDGDTGLQARTIINSLVNAINNSTTGTSGTSGEAGLSGTSGTSGVAGSSGSSGTSGVAGISGVDGINGTSGTSGTSGVGTSGTSGLTGTSGTSGTRGTSGTSGVSGSSGTNGTSGIGVPTGGTSGQVLSKIDGTDYNTQWVNMSTQSGGSLPAHIEYNEIDKTLWNNGHSDVSSNLSFGEGALTSASLSAYDLIAIGSYSLANATDTFDFISIGSSAGSNVGAYSYGNIAIGNYSLGMCEAWSNLAIGTSALYGLTTGYNNASINGALGGLTTGADNIGIGISAGKGLITGSSNVIIGIEAGAGGLNDVSDPKFDFYGNTIIGDRAGSVYGGNNSTMLGAAAGMNSAGITTGGDNNVLIGNGTAYWGSAENNTLIGTNATGLWNSSGVNNQIVIGYNAQGNGANRVTLGNSSITTLRCQVTSITALSDARDKSKITPLSEGIDFINQLNPVTFEWNTRDGSKVGQKAAGFIAQDLLELQNNSEIGENLDLVDTTDSDKLEARYGHLIPVMVKAIQELSSKVEELTSELNLLKNN